MKFEGTFKTVDNANKYKVEIGTGNTFEITDPTETGEVAERDDKVMFDVVPVTIKCDRSDLNKRIIISQAEVNLISNIDLTDYFFAVNNRDVPLRITEISGNTPVHVFYGFVDPLQFDQGYAHNYEQVSITATDPLGALESITLDKIDVMDNDGTYVTKDDLHVQFSTETQISPYALMLSILTYIGVEIDTSEITDQQHPSINSTVLNCMKGTKLLCQIFFGDDKDDYKSLYDILETICKYFNLYIAIKNSYELLNIIHSKAIISCTVYHENKEFPIPVNFTSFKDIATDESTSISMDDVYTQIQLTCNIEPVEDLVESITDKDHLYSDYDNEEHYMTEYYSEMDEANITSGTPYNGFRAIVNGLKPDYDYCWKSDNYVYVLRNDAWDFGEGFAGQQGPQGSQGFNPDYKSYVNVMGGGINHKTGEPTPMGAAHQYDILYWMLGANFSGNQGPTRNCHPVCRAALLGFDKRKDVNLKSISDNSPQKPELDKYLVISTNGQGDQEIDALRGYQSLLEPMRRTPLCKYTNLKSNILSPADADTTNYIVISGEILLNALQGLTGGRPFEPTSELIGKTWDNSVKYCIDISDWAWLSNNSCYLGIVGKNNNYMYYQQKWDKSTAVKGGLYGNLNNSAQKSLQYNYSAPGDTNDKISKMPILACQLKVGDNDETAKYCIEQLWLGEAGVNNFVWMTIQDMRDKEAEINPGKNPQDPDFYHIEDNPIFTIGIDPKIGDYIIGQKYQLSQNSNNLNIDKEGMAIPVKASDNLTGTVEFSILGPFNSIFEDYIHLYKSYWFWKFDAWITNPISILNRIQSIMIGDLKIELTSNNAGLSEMKTTKDNDLVYYSNTNPTFLEIDEQDIDICTSLTTQEHKDWQIKIQNSNSYVLNNNGSSFFGFTSGQEKIKPEQCLIDYLYKEYCTPSRILDTQVKSSAFTNGLYGNALNVNMLRNYYTGLPIVVGLNDVFKGRIMSYETNLKYKNVDVKFRQHKTTQNIQI